MWVPRGLFVGILALIAGDFLLPRAAAATSWDAGRDLATNELSGPALASMNPNPTVTNWSYGYRLESALATTNFTLLEHHATNANGSPGLAGWYRPTNDGPAEFVNISANPVVLSFCCGPLLPINPGEISLWPGNDGTAAVVRWTAPTTANYAVSAYWRKIDTHGNNGCVSSVVVNGTVLYTQTWLNGDTPGYTNTVAFTAGDVVDFLLGPAGNYSFDGTKFNAVIQELSNLPPITSSSASAAASPIDSATPWTFTATYSTLVSDLRLRVQSALTANVESNWTDLPGNPYMTDADGTWTLHTSDVPPGVHYFRVLASATHYLDAVSSVLGPYTVLDGIAPFGDFTWETVSPFRTGTPWAFSIVESSVISGLSLRLQSAPTPDVETNWTDLSGGQMTRFPDSPTWALYTSDLPTGTVYFRVVASAPNYSDRVSAVLGPFDIGPPLPVVTKTYSTSTTTALDSIPETQNPSQVNIVATNQANLNLVLTNNSANFIAPVTLAAQPPASTSLTVGSGQTVTAPGITAGLAATAVLQGTIKGALSLISSDGAGTVSQGAGNVVSHDGGTLTHDSNTASLIGNAGGTLIGNAGGTLIAAAGASFHPDSSSVAASVPAPRRVTPKGPGPTQPAFTGLMTVDGNYYQFAGTLFIGVAGTNTASQGAQQFDQLVVSGTANLFGGSLTVGLFNPDNQTNRAVVFQPPNGSTFDVVVASNIVVMSSFTVRGSAVWGDGLFFNWGIVTRLDGLQALRLVAAPYPPVLTLQRAGSMLQLSYPTNYAGYTVQSTPTLAPTNWTTFSTGINVVTLSATNTGQFFRLSKP